MPAALIAGFVILALVGQRNVDRAGQQGRRLMVTANEVRKLAERVRNLLRLTAEWQGQLSRFAM